MPYYQERDIISIDLHRKGAQDDLTNLQETLLHLHITLDIFGVLFVEKFGISKSWSLRNFGFLLNIDLSLAMMFRVSGHFRSLRLSGEGVSRVSKEFFGVSKT